jgi:ElaB/YqjD/DUF883 family membrane-anchored ribosome-binding protein
MSRKDQLVAPAPPVVVFPTQQTADRVLASLKALYDQAAKYALERGTIAVQKAEEIRVLEAEVNERLAWIAQKTGERDQADADARDARDTAKVYADYLSMSGVHVPPPDGELSFNPDAKIRNIEAAHEELDRESGRPL